MARSRTTAQRSKQVARSTRSLVKVASGPEVDELRVNHPRVTDQQAELVEYVLMTGDGPTAAAEALGMHASYISKTLRLPHVLGYSQDLAMMSLGSTGLRALARAINLLDSKSDRVASDIAMDLMNRAGIGVSQASQAPQLGVQINFNTPGGQGGPTDISPEPRGPKKAS